MLFTAEPRVMGLGPLAINLGLCLVKRLASLPGSATDDQDSNRSHVTPPFLHLGNSVIGDELRVCRTIANVSRL